MLILKTMVMITITITIIIMIMIMIMIIHMIIIIIMMIMIIIILLYHAISKAQALLPKDIALPATYQSLPRMWQSSWCGLTIEAGYGKGVRASASRHDEARSNIFPSPKKLAGKNPTVNLLPPVSITIFRQTRTLTFSKSAGTIDVKQI